MGSEYQAFITKPKVAIAEKGAVILNAVLANPHLSQEQLQELVQKPILSILAKYQKEGYLVLDASITENGLYTISTLPENNIDVTKEMKQAVDEKFKAAEQARVKK